MPGLTRKMTNGECPRTLRVLFLDSSHAEPLSDRDRKAWQIAYDKWLATQEQFERVNEHDEREDR